VRRNDSNHNAFAAKCIERIVLLISSVIDGFRFEELHAYWHSLVVMLYSERELAWLDPGV